jgi:YVTN family beta-propeller protein
MIFPFMRKLIHFCTHALWFALCLAAPAQTPQHPVRAVTDPGVVTTRQTVTPAGIQTVFNGRVYGVAFGASPSEVWVLNGHGGKAQIFRLDWAANKVLQHVRIDDHAGLQGIQYDRAGERVLLGTALPEPEEGNAAPRARVFSVENGVATVVADLESGHLAGALAVAQEPNAQGQRLAVVPLVHDNVLALVDVNNRQLIGKVKTGIAPFGAVVNRAGTVAYVTNWGGRWPTPKDLTAPAGRGPKVDQVVVDERGIASTGTVTRIDLATRTATDTISVDLHPTAIIWDEAHQKLFVANSNRDSVSVIDTVSNKVAETISVQPFERAVAGIAPTALILSPDGGTLYVACGGINALAVVDTTTRRVRGLIPTAWYPNALALSPDGRQLAIATLLGVGSGWQGDPSKRQVYSYRGAISVVAVPDETQLSNYTTAVAENNHLAIGPVKSNSPASVRRVPPVAIPQRAGEPSLIEHVVFIVKENRTYDQVFGDMEQGNGDPSLVLFGEDVTPNHHRLASQFVLLDNFYATGGNSGDGHQWLTQANETAYALWPGYTGRSYPFDGTDPIAPAANGFIWDAALRMKKTVRVYGEYAGRMSATEKRQRAKLLERWKAGEDFTKLWHIEAPLKPLNKILANNYPPFALSIPDVVRAQIFLADLKSWEKNGQMPNLTMMTLPCDHTSGSIPRGSTVKAMMADNDLALGQIVEALSKSPFWSKMAIFVVEDDAQDGVDHVDGHRTVALVVSPYSRRGYVDSTFYSQPSMLKSIELVLGLPTLSLFDLIANDMGASFTNLPDLNTFTAVTPKQSLFEENPALGDLKGSARKDAIDSMAMPFDVPDAIPTARLNQVIWHQVKGPKVSQPAANHSAWAPMSADIDDDERGQR